MKAIAYFFLAVVVISGCRKIEVDGPQVANPGGSENTTLIGRITENRTLKRGTTYTLDGIVYVTNGAVLTVEGGAKIVGGSNQKGGLVITRNAKLIAQGTLENPVVFTSGSATPQRGDWAGLVILGNAPTNATFNGQSGVGEVEGGINNSDGLGLYGGNNPADNSGILKYVRIEYAGYAFLPDKEINGLTMAGVGNQTIVDYVQVSYANDDSFEWFGGTVNCKHLISYRTLDDDFDTDNGFAGNVQFGIVLRDSAVADISRSEAFESDNDANGSSLAPQTASVFTNMTILGPRATLQNLGNSLFLGGAQIRRNSTISIFNSLILGWPQGVLIDASKGTPTDNNIMASTLFLQATVIAGSPVPVKYAPSPTSPTGATDATINTWFNTPAFGNQILTTNDAVGLIAPFNYTAPDFNPAASSVPTSGASFVNNKLKSDFFTVTTYRGACAVGDTWWKGWSKF